MGFLSDAVDKVKDVVGGGDDSGGSSKKKSKDSSGGGSSEESFGVEKSSEDSSGADFSDKSESKRGVSRGSDYGGGDSGKRGKEPDFVSGGVGGGTSGGGTSGGGTSGGSPSRGKKPTFVSGEKAEKKLQPIREKKKQQDKQRQRTTQARTQKIQKQLQKQSKDRAGSPRMTTQKAPSQFRISQKKRQNLYKSIGKSDKKSGKPTTISAGKDEGYSEYTSTYNQSTGAGLVQSFGNVAELPKKFVEGKRGEDLYGGTFRPLKLSGKTGAQEKVLVNAEGDIIGSSDTLTKQQLRAGAKTEGYNIRTKGELQDVAIQERESKYEKKVEDISQKTKRDIQEYRAQLQKKVGKGDISPKKAESSLKAYQNKKVKSFQDKAGKVKVDKDLPFSKSELIKTKGQELKEAGGLALDIGAGVAGGPAAVGYFAGKGAVKASEARGGMGSSSISASTISPSEKTEITTYFGGAALEGGQYLKNIERGIVSEDLRKLGKQPIKYRGKEFVGGKGKSKVITKAQQKYGDLTREFDIYGDVAKTKQGEVTVVPSGKVSTKTRGKLPYSPFGRGGSGKSTKILQQQDFTLGAKSKRFEELGEGISAGETKLFPESRTNLIYRGDQEQKVLSQLKKGKGKYFKRYKGSYENLRGFEESKFDKTLGLSKTKRTGKKGQLGGEIYESQGVGVTKKGKVTAPPVEGKTEVVELPTTETTGYKILGPGQKKTPYKYGEDLLGTKGKPGGSKLGKRKFGKSLGKGTGQGKGITRETGTGKGARTKLTTKKISPSSEQTTQNILIKSSKQADTTLGLGARAGTKVGTLTGARAGVRSLTDTKGSLKTGLKARTKGKIKTESDVLTDLRTDLGIKSRPRVRTDLDTYKQPTPRIKPPRARTPFGGGTGAGFALPKPPAGGGGRRPKAKGKRKLKGRKTQYTPSVTALSLGIRGSKVSELYKKGGGGLGIRPIINGKKSKKKKNKKRRK